MGRAVGMIETHGAIAAYVALDAAVKAAYVELCSCQRAGGGLSMVVFTGDTAAVIAAADAGKAAALRLGRPVHTHVIPRLSVEAEILLENIHKSPECLRQSPLKENKNEPVKSSGDQIDAEAQATTLDVKVSSLPDEQTSQKTGESVSEKALNDSLIKGDTIIFKDKAYNVFKDSEIGNLKLSELRQLAGLLGIQTDTGNMSKSRIVKLIREYIKEV